MAFALPYGNEANGNRQDQKRKNVRSPLGMDRRPARRFPSVASTGGAGPVCWNYASLLGLLVGVAVTCFRWPSRHST